MADAMSRPAGSVTHGASSGTQPSHSGERNPWLILLVLCGAIFMLLLDTTIVNVAQQKIKEGLNADLSQIQWILDSYILAFAVLMLSFGRIGDIYGRKKMFVTGMAIFIAASGLCGVSQLDRRSRRHPWRDRVDRRPGAARDRRRIDDAADALPDYGRLSAAEAWRRHGRLGVSRGPGRGARTVARRLHRDPLPLGMGLPDQYPGRHRRHPRHAGDRSRVA